MGDRELLLHLSSIDKNFSIQRGRYLRVLQQTYKVSRDQADTYRNTVFKTRQNELRKIDLQISPLSIGMYNAVVNLGSPIDIKQIIEKVSGEVGLVGGATEANFRYGRFQVGLKFTNQYGLVGNPAKPIVSADFKAPGLSISFFKTGKIRLSGNYNKRPRDVLDTFSAYWPVPAGTAIDINNVVAEFRIGYKMNIHTIHTIFYEPGAPHLYDGYDVSVKYEKEKIIRKKKVVGEKQFPTTLLYATFKKNKETVFTATFSPSGVIQIQGTSDFDKAYTVLKKLVVSLKNNDLLVMGSGAQRFAPKKVPRIRPVITNNIPAPSVTRRGTTCPMGRRPVPYGYEGTCSQEGCYIKPNPQGQPCCYSEPTRKEYSRDKVLAAYLKAGIHVPDSVRRIFGIVSKNTAVEVSRKKPAIVLSGNKIDSRQCLRYTKVALTDIAERLHIILPRKVTKPILCALIKEESEAAPKRMLAITRIQRAARKYLARKTGPRPRNVAAATKIQAAARRFLKRKQAATRIQAAVRGHSTRGRNLNYEYFMRGPQ